MKALFIILLIITFLSFHLGKIYEPLTPLMSNDDTKGTLKRQEEDIKVYLTNNQLNYDYIDGVIQTLERSYNLMKYQFDNLRFAIGNVRTIYGLENPSLSIGGSFPSNIELHFEFPTPRPGPMGQRGEQGDKGEKGPEGLKGVRGARGGSSLCQ